jgi:hypothetical protein
MHNLTALQMLDFLRKQLAGNPAVGNLPTITAMP